jgi:hypothetical protein
MSVRRDRTISTANANGRSYVAATATASASVVLHRVLEIGEVRNTAAQLRDELAAREDD